MAKLILQNDNGSQSVELDITNWSINGNTCFIGSTNTINNEDDLATVQSLLNGSSEAESRPIASPAKPTTRLDTTDTDETLGITVVSALPTSNIKSNLIYCVGTTTYNQYMYKDDEWVNIGTTVDLSNFVDLN